VRGPGSGRAATAGLRRTKEGLDPEKYGARTCWSEGLVVICHGNSSRHAIANALRFGAGALSKVSCRHRTELAGSPAVDDLPLQGRRWYNSAR